MGYVDRRTGIEIIERGECLRLLEHEVVGRLGILDGGSPLILPVNFAMDDDNVVFRTAAGTKLDAARGMPACFEIDGHDDDHRNGWSVVIRGRVEEVTHLDHDVYRRVQELAHPWADGEHDHVVRLVPTSIQGRRIVNDAEAASPAVAPRTV